MTTSPPRKMRDHIAAPLDTTPNGQAAQSRDEALAFIREIEARVSQSGVRGIYETERLVSSIYYNAWPKLRVLLEASAASDHQSGSPAAVVPNPLPPEVPGVKGWQMVPVEPTRDMLSAAEREWDKDGYYVTRGYINEGHALTAYRAMLAAAPVLSGQGRDHLDSEKTSPTEIVTPTLKPDETMK